MLQDLNNSKSVLVTMAEKGGTKILVAVTVCVMLVSIGLSGCVGDEDDE